MTKELENAVDKLSIKEGVISYGGIDYKESNEALLLCLDYIVTLGRIEAGERLLVSTLDKIAEDLAKHEIQD